MEIILFSPKQGCFHVERISSLVATNLLMLKESGQFSTDYQVVGYAQVFYETSTRIEELTELFEEWGIKVKDPVAELQAEIDQAKHTKANRA